MIEIDTLAATQFETAAKTRRETLTSTAATVRAQLSGGGLSTRVADLMSELAGHVEIAGTNFGDAARRASDADDTGATAITAQFSALGLTMLNPLGVAPTNLDPDLAASAEQIANDLKDDPGDPKKQQAAIDFMQDNMDNPELMAKFIETIGPEALLEIPAKLASALDTYDRSDLNAELEAEKQRAIEGQDDVMRLLGQALATATDKGGLDPEQYAEKLASIVIGDPDRVENWRLAGVNDTNPWALSQLLRNGNYSYEFLTKLADELDEYERIDNRDARSIWGSRMPDSYDYALGKDRNTGYYDPFVGLFEAMSRNPDAALDFFYSDNNKGLYTEKDKISDRPKYYIKNRTWSHDNFDALGQILDSAATAYRDPTAPGYTKEKGENSAEMATDAINYLGDRKGDPKIGVEAYDSLGHILAAYIVEIDDIARTNQAGDHDADGTWGEFYKGLPPTAGFDGDKLLDVMNEVLTDEAALEQVFDAANEFSSLRLGWAIGQDPSTVSDPPNPLVDHGMANVAIGDGSALTGYIVGAAGKGAEKAGERRDELNAKIISLVEDLASLVPTGGTITSFIADQAIGLGNDYVTSKATGNLAAAQEAHFDLSQSAKQAFKFSVCTQLVNEKKIGAEDLPRWFKGPYWKKVWGISVPDYSRKDGDFNLEEAEADPGEFTEDVFTQPEWKPLETTLTEDFDQGHKKGSETPG